MSLNIARGVCLVVAALALAGCKIEIDAPQTPTVAVSPTRDETAIARLATATPTLTQTPTVTPSATATPTSSPTASATATLAPSPTPSDTATATSTPSATATRTHTATLTSSPSPTATLTRTATATPSLTATRAPSPTPTDTAQPTSTDTATATSTMTVTASPTATQRPLQTATQTATATPRPTQTQTLTPAVTRSATPTSTASITAPPMPTPSPPIAQPQIPSATPRPSLTFTPFPTLTPNTTATSIAENRLGVTPTRTPGGIYTLTPTSTPPPTPTLFPTASAGASFYDANAAPGDQESLPLAPVGDTGPSGPPVTIPEQNNIIISYAGQVVPILPLPGGISTGSALAQGSVFSVSPYGAVAAFGSDRWLRINGQTVIVSPASEWGLHPNLSIGDLVWSPDGQRLAFRVDAANPNEFNGIDSGVWIYEPATNRSWQVFRDTYQAEQLHQQRRAIRLQWAPNGLALVVTVDTPLGLANVFMPVDHDANVFIDSIPYANATWTRDSAALIVSGATWDNRAVIGRIALDANWTYTEYASHQTTGLVMQAAIELADGRIAFLGSPSPGSFALYAIYPTVGAQPAQLSERLIDGQMVYAEWNPERTAALVTAQTTTGQQLWILRTDGRVLNTTPTAGMPDAAHWR